MRSWDNCFVDAVSSVLFAVYDAPADLSKVYEGNIRGQTPIHASYAMDKYKIKLWTEAIHNVTLIIFIEKTEH